MSLEVSFHILSQHHAILLLKHLLRAQYMVSQAKSTFHCIIFLAKIS